MPLVLTAAEDGRAELLDIQANASELATYLQPSGFFRAMVRLQLFFALPALVILSALPHPVSAQVQFAPDEEYVRCVQAEVTEIGFNARGVDGNIGPGTRSAVADFADTVGLNSPPEISDDTAWPWCVMLTLVRSCLEINNFSPTDFSFTGFRGGSVTGLELRGAFIVESSEDNAVTAWLAGYHPSFQDSSFCYATEGEVDAETGDYILNVIRERGPRRVAIFGPQQAREVDAETRRVQYALFNVIADFGSE